jgi:hypothetical protein
VSTPGVCHEISLFDNHDFEILARNHQRRGSCRVASLKQCRDVFFQRLLTDVVECRERFVRRPIIITEYLQPVRGRAITEVEVLACRADVCRLCTEQVDDMRLGSP